LHSGHAVGLTGVRAAPPPHAASCVCSSKRAMLDCAAEGLQEAEQSRLESSHPSEKSLTRLQKTINLAHATTTFEKQKIEEIHLQGF
jgi:hypothetical protein